jgi:hypothetical protein
MTIDSHIHIIASGENNHNTIPHAINEFKMDKAIIIVDKDVYENPSANMHNPAIIKSINKVEDMVKVTNKKFELKYIDKISLNSVRDAVLEIVDENQGSTLYFNVSGGTKVLSNGLFMMAIWLDGIVYHVGEDNKLQRLIIPRVHSEEIRKNENYIIILDILSKSLNRQKLRKTLYKEMLDRYKPIRDMGITKRKLAQGTLTKWTSDLEKWGLISIDNPKNNRKDKVYTIKDDGIFTLKFITATSKKQKN